MNVHIPYFFSYKMAFFSFQNNLKNLNLSDKTGLGLWDCLGRVKLIAKFQKWTDLVTCSHSREGKPPSYQLNKYGKFRLCPLIRNFTDEAELDNALFSYTFDNVLSPHQNDLTKAVQMKGHNTCFRRGITELSQNYLQNLIFYVSLILAMTF